jgi:FtsP/CotA-like multicopper oxidase with cupredoxin domain
MPLSIWFLFKGILINGQFPGPRIDCVTNDNLVVNVVNNLDEPFLITWSVQSI